MTGIVPALPAGSFWWWLVAPLPSLCKIFPLIENELLFYFSNSLFIKRMKFTMELKKRKLSLYCNNLKGFPPPWFVTVFWVDQCTSNWCMCGKCVLCLHRNSIEMLAPSDMFSALHFGFRLFLGKGWNTSKQLYFWL